MVQTLARDLRRSYTGRHERPAPRPFGEIAWTEAAPGIRARETDVGGARWAMVEYGPGASREDWCEEGHRGFVVEGEIEYRFDDGREPLRAGKARRSCSRRRL